MRYALLSVALCAAVQAAPIQNTASEINGNNNILLGRNRYIVGDTDTVARRKTIDHDTEDESWILESTPITDSSTPATTATTSTEPIHISEEDPVLLQILTHVEDILSSNSAPSDQVQWILDAIVHHTESMREVYEDIWPADDILNLVDDVMIEDLSDDEKVEIIFNEIVLHTKLKGSVELPVHEPVLYRVKAVLYGQDSCQQKIKSILDEIAAHLGREDVLESWGSEQVSFAEPEVSEDVVEDPYAWEDKDEPWSYVYIDEGERPEWATYGNTV